MNPKYAQKFNELNEKLGNPDNFNEENEDEESSSMSDLDNERYFSFLLDFSKNLNFILSLNFSNFPTNEEPMDAESERPSLKLKLSLKPSKNLLNLNSF